MIPKGFAARNDEPNSAIPCTACGLEPAPEALERAVQVGAGRSPSGAAHSQTAGDQADAAGLAVHRHELFDDVVQAELETTYRNTAARADPVQPKPDTCGAGTKNCEPWSRAGECQSPTPKRAFVAHGRRRGLEASTGTSVSTWSRASLSLARAGRRTRLALATNPGLVGDGEIAQMGLGFGVLCIDCHVDAALVDGVLGRGRDVAWRPLVSPNESALPKAAFKSSVRERTTTCRAGEVERTLERRGANT